MSRLIPHSVLLTCLFAFSIKAADWPQWRGPERTGRSQETGLLKQWSEDGPKVLWKADDVGKAYASVAVADGRVFTQGNLEEEGRIHCFDEKTGDLIWSVRPPREKKVFTHGRGDGPRGTPTVDGRLVYCEGGEGSRRGVAAALELLDESLTSSGRSHASERHGRKALGLD